MRKIALTQNKFALVDDEDYLSLCKHKWYAAKYPCNYYAFGKIITKNNVRLNIRMHRFILKPPPGKQVDHINGNGLDNRRCNLRVCTNSENQQNRHKVCSNSGFKGVSWDKNENKWRTKIGVKGKTIHIGYYDEKLDAAHAYDVAANSYFGVFAKLNFPKMKDAI
jgi:hypothetical protein